MRCSPPSRANSASREARNGAEDPHLLAVLQLGLEAHHVEQRAELVVLPKLHDRIRLDVRPMRVGQPERLHRPVAQRLASALGHDLDRQAAVEIGRIRFELAECDLFAAQQRIDEGVVLLARERTIDVVGAGAARACFVVARLEPGDVEVDGLAMNDRRDGIKESERGFPAQLADRLGQRLGGQRAGGDDDAVPVRPRARRFLRAGFRSAARVRAPRVIAAEKPSRSTASAPPAGQLVLIGGAHDQRGEPPHLGMQETDGASLRIVGPERIGTNELGEIRPFCALRSSEPAAFHATPRARPGARSARRLRNRQGRRRSHGLGRSERVMAYS